MATGKKIDKHDHTITKRAVAHVEKLKTGGGRRLVVDLQADHSMMLDQLLASGYAATAVGVIRRAVEEASRSAGNTTPVIPG